MKTGCVYEPKFDDVDTSNARYSHLNHGQDKKGNAAINSNNRKKGCNDVDIGRWSHLDSDCGCNGSDKKEKHNMFSLQNCTLQSKVQGNGESYWVSFEEKSFSKGNDFKVYSGKMNGKGPRSGEKCVVKVFRQCKGTEQLCLCELKKSYKAKMIARVFNSEIKERKVRIKMATVFWANMDEVSCLKALLFPSQRKLTCGEAVLFEDDVRINDDKPGKPRKLTTFMDSQGQPRRCKAKVLEAFAHFTYHHTNGQLVICGLDGVQDEDGFFLKTPTIHSRTQEYGSTDNGDQGISDVFSNHVCNEICSHMIKPDTSNDQVSVTNNGVGVEHNCSTQQPANQGVDLQRQESTVSQFSETPQYNSNRPCPTSWPNLKVVGVSESTPNPDYSHRPATLEWQQSGMSRLSQVACCSDLPLEPSAPVEEIDGIYLPAPPPYSEMFVANWILGEQAPNSFIPPVQDDTSLLAGRDRPADIMHVEQGLLIREENLNERPRDVNANPCDETSTSSRASTPGCCDGTESQTSVVFSPSQKKQVRFSLSTETVSNGTPVSTTLTSSGSDSPMETSTFASETSSPRVHPRSILRQDSSLSSQQSNFHNPCHVIPSHVAFPATGSAMRPVLHRQDNIMSTPSYSGRDGTLDNPPTYEDSEFTTAFWVMRQGYIQLTTLINMTENNNNSHSHIANTTTSQTPSIGLVNNMHSH